jgi:hypothetical protein
MIGRGEALPFKMAATAAAGVLALGVGIELVDAGSIRAGNKRKIGQKSLPR